MTHGTESGAAVVLLDRPRRKAISATMGIGLQIIASLCRSLRQIPHCEFSCCREGRFRSYMGAVL